MKFHKKVLGNGMTVLFEKRDVPVTTVMLATKFGSEYETEEEKGIAHFIEHMAFKGTEKRTTREIAFELEKVGGILNAFTEEEETAYYVKLPSEHLNIAMDVIFDIFFNPKLEEEEMKKESSVICEEIKMYHDTPQRHVIEGIKSCLYKGSFGMFGAGTEKTVKSITREQLLAKHRKMYSPQNAILAVVGNNDFNEILQLAEKFSVERKLENPVKEKMELQNLKKVETRQDLEQANVVMGFHFPYNEDKYAGMVFETILGSGMSSKLFTEVREKRGLAYAVKTNFFVGKNYGYLIIYIGTEKSKVDEVIKICNEEFKKMANINEKELEDGKQQIIGNYEVASEDSENSAQNLVSEEISGKAEDYYLFKENISKVSLDDIKKLAEINDYASFVLM